MIPELISTQRIWDAAPHCAFVDLIRFQNRWICAFREGADHVKGSNGRIRLLESQDCRSWCTKALLLEEGIDLRDPKLSITPNGCLMLLAGGTIYSKKGEYISRQPRVAFSQDGANWAPFTPILAPHEWLWRITWHEGTAYGISYLSEKQEGDWAASLFRSLDGIHYKKICQLEVPGYPSEATVRFLKNGEMMALIRRKKHSWIGTSPPPFTDWHWSDSGVHFAGPNFLILPNGSTWAAGRILQKKKPKTALATMSQTTLRPLLELPSGGDCSYPGMVWHNERLWISYYSSHEKGCAIYLAEVKLSEN